MPRAACRAKAPACLGVLAAVALLVAGCAGKSGVDATPDMGVRKGAAAQEALRVELNEFVDFFAATVAQAADGLGAGDASAGGAEAGVLWKVRVKNTTDAILGHPDAAKNLLDLWVFAQELADYLAVGEGKSLFGDEQPTAIDAMARVLARAEEIAQDFLGSAEFPAIKAQVTAYAESHPIRGVFAQQESITLRLDEVGLQMIAQVFDVPLSTLQIFSKFNQGSDALRAISYATTRFVDVLGNLPEQGRWQTELLLLRLQKNPLVGSLLASIQTLTANSTRYADIADALPGKLREAAAGTIDDVMHAQPAVQESLDRAHALAAEVHATVDRTVVLVEQARTTSEAIQTTAEALSETVRDIGHLLRRDDAGTSATLEDYPSRHRFDITEYRDAAQQITTGLTELRAALADIEGAGQSGAWRRAAQDVAAESLVPIDRAADRTRALIDHAFIRLAELIGLIFALALVWRFVVARPRRTEPR